MGIFQFVIITGYNYDNSHLLFIHVCLLVSNITSVTTNITRCLVSSGMLQYSIRRRLVHVRYHNVSNMQDRLLKWSYRFEIWQATHQPRWWPKRLLINSSLRGQNGRHFAADLLRYIFENEKFCILMKISLKFVPMVPIDNKLALGLDNGLAPTKRQAIISTSTDPIYWRIYTALGRDELNFRAIRKPSKTISHMRHCNILR